MALASTIGFLFDTHKIANGFGQDLARACASRLGQSLHALDKVLIPQIDLLAQQP